MEDLTGRIFGDWTVLGMITRDHPDYSGRSKAMCRCSCGVIKPVLTYHLKSGKSTSCGHVKDLSGTKIGSATVINRADDYISPKGEHKIMWNVLCNICGKIFVAPGTRITRGKVKMCMECSIKAYTKHGMSETRLYNVYKGIKRRCYGKSSPNYYRYGGRGIEMCKEWKNDFTTFYAWAMSQEYDESADRGELTVDRIDVNGNYCPENCRLVSMKEQANNTRSNIRIDYHGVTYTASTFAELMNIPYHRVRFWFHDGLSADEIIIRNQENPYRPLPRRSK